MRMCSNIESHLRHTIIDGKGVFEEMSNYLGTTNWDKPQSKLNVKQGEQNYASKNFNDYRSNISLNAIDLHYCY